MTAGELEHDDLAIDEKARDGLTKLSVAHAGCQAEVTTKLDTLIENQNIAIAKQDATGEQIQQLCDRVDEHDFWIKAGKRFMGSVTGIVTLVGGAWVLRKLGL